MRDITLPLQSEPWESYHHPFIRDLVWLWASPPLLTDEILSPLGSNEVRLSSEFCFSEVQRFESQLKDWDANPLPLEAFLESEGIAPQLRIGRRAESLLSFWIQHFYRPDPFFRNQPLKQGNRVLGEFDFLFQSPFFKKIQHWEASVKFYLLPDEGSGSTLTNGPKLSDFMGLRWSDRPDQKALRLREHQLLLSTRPEAKAFFGDSFSGSQDVEVRALIKGRLFYPRHLSWENIPSPPGAALNHLRGWWCSLDQLETALPRDPELRWALLPKAEWMAPKKSLPHPLYSRTDFIQAAPEFLATPSAQSGFVVSEGHEASGGWQELNRGFVTHPLWNQEALARRLG